MATTSMGRTPEEQAEFDEQQEFSNGFTVAETSGQLFERLTPSSTVGEISAAYNEFQQNNGGNSAANRDVAKLFLNSLGIPSSTIEQGLSAFSGARPGRMTSAEAQENIYKELQRQSKSLGTEKRFQTGAAGSKEGGLGSTDAVMRDMAKKLADAGLTSIEQFGQGKVPVIEQVAAIPEYVNGTTLLGYSEFGPEYNQVPSGRWLYEVTENVGENPTTSRRYIDDAEVARLGLSGTEPKVVDLKTGERDGFINKDTGEPLTSLTGYDGRGWSGTSAGDGQTIYNVKFDESTGLPMFFNQQKHGKDDYADFLKVLAIGTAIFAPQIGAALLPAGSSAAAALAVGSAVSGLIGSGGDIKSAIKAGLASYLGGQAGSWASRTANSALVGTIATNMTRAAILGGDMEQALVASLVQAAPAEIIKQFPNFAQLPRAAQEAAVAATVDLMRTGGENLDQIALQGATKGATDYALSNIEGYKDLRPAQQEIVRTRVSNVLNGESLSDELLQGAIAFGNEAVQYQVNDEKAKKDGWADYETQQAAKTLYGDKVTPDLYADKQNTTEDEAKEIARTILGREPTEFEYMQLVGLSEGDAAQNSDLAAIRYDESTFDSNELAEAYKAVYGVEPTAEWLASDEAMDMLGRSDVQAKNILQNYYIKDKNTTTGTEAEAMWKAMGNTGPIPEDVLFNMLSMSQPNATAYAQNYTDATSVTFDGSGYETTAQARAAAINAGYNSFTDPVTGTTQVILPEDENLKRANLVRQALNLQGIDPATATAEQRDRAMSLVSSIPQDKLDGSNIVTDTQASIPIREELLRQYVKSIGKQRIGQLTDAEFNGFVKKLDVFGSDVQVLRAASLQDILSGNYTASPDYAQKTSGDGPFRVEVSGVGTSYYNESRPPEGTFELPYGARYATKEEIESTDPSIFRNVQRALTSSGRGVAVVYGDEGTEDNPVRMRDESVPLSAVEVASSVFDLVDKYGGSSDDANTLRDVLSGGTQGLAQLTKIISDAMWANGLVDRDNVVARTAEALNRFGEGKQSDWTKKEAEQWLKDIENAGERVIEVGGKKITLPDWVNKSWTAFESGARNPGGALIELGKEAVQELPWMLAGGGVGKLITSVFGKVAGFTSARLTNAGLDGLEAYGANAGETYDSAIKAGRDPYESLMSAQKSGLQALAIGLGASWLSDGPLVKALMGDMTKISASTFSKELGKQYITGWGEEFSQNVSSQWNAVGSVDWNQAQVAGSVGGVIQVGLAGGILAPSLIKYDSVVAQDADGEDVTLQQFLSGTKQVDMSTLDTGAAVSEGAGPSFTLGDLENYSNIVETGKDVGIAEYFATVDMFREAGVDLTDSDIIELTNYLSGEGERSTEEIQNKFDEYTDDRIVTSDEAAQILLDLGYANPTAEEIAQFSGVRSQADAISKAGEYVTAKAASDTTVVATNPDDGTALVTDGAGNVEVVDNTDGSLTVGDVIADTGLDAAAGGDTVVDTGAATGTDGTVLSVDNDSGTALVVNDTGNTTVVDNTDGSLVVGDTTAPTPTPTFTPTAQTPTTPTPSSGIDSIERILIDQYGWIDNGDGTLTTTYGQKYDRSQGGILADDVAVTTPTTTTPTTTTPATTTTTTTPATTTPTTTTPTTTTPATTTPTTSTPTTTTPTTTTPATTTTTTTTTTTPTTTTPTTTTPTTGIDGVEKILIDKYGWTNNGDGTLTTKYGQIYDNSQGGILTPATKTPTKTPTTTTPTPTTTPATTPTTTTPTTTTPTTTTPTTTTPTTTTPTTTTTTPTTTTPTTTTPTTTTPTPTTPTTTTPTTTTPTTTTPTTTTPTTTTPTTTTPTTTTPTTPTPTTPTPTTPTPTTPTPTTPTPTTPTPTTPTPTTPTTPTPTTPTPTTPTPTTPTTPTPTTPTPTTPTTPTPTTPTTPTPTTPTPTTPTPTTPTPTTPTPTTPTPTTPTPTTPTPPAPVPAPTPVPAPAPTPVPTPTPEPPPKEGVKTPASQELIEALYSTMDYYDPFDDPFAQTTMRSASTKAPTNQTKMAQGGYLDDLLAENISVDDLLKLLR